MANHLLRTVQVVKRSPCLASAGLRYGSHSTASQIEYELSKIGNREIVGFGINGQPNYIDQIDFPCPAIRFKADTPEIKALREKEKGDWHKLTKEEKKALYRASFCQTFAELEAPTGLWKSVVGVSLGAIAFSFWIMMGLKKFVYDPLPESLSLESRQAQLQRMLDLEIDIVDGLSSHYDYEKETWKTTKPL